MIPEALIEVDAARPELLRKNTHESCGQFLYFACLALNNGTHEPWGLLSKERSENGVTWPNDVRTSHDAIIHKGTQEVFDIISSAGAGSPTTPSWTGPQPKRPHNVWTPLSAVPAPGGGAPKPPQPVPPPAPSYPPYPPTESDVDGAGVALFADFAQAGQPPNPQMFRLAFRVAYSWLTQESASLPASVAKHRAEWRKLLGLQP